MRKAIVILVSGFFAAVLLSMCGTYDKFAYDYVHSAIKDLQVALYDAKTVAPVNGTVLHTHLRLKMSFDLQIAETVSASRIKGFFPSAYAYAGSFPVNIGLLDKIASMSLVCDKPIGGIAKGEELLSDVTKSPYYNTGETWTITEWVNMLNAGESKKAMFLEGARTYYLITKFATANVDEDDYTFTLKLDYASGENPYVVTFPPVRLK